MMKNVCPSCGYDENPESAHFCGSCGKMLGVKEHKWSVYNSEKSFLLPKDYFGGIINMLIGFCCIVLPVIAWINPKIIDEIPSYMEGTLVKIIWIISTVVLIILGLLLMLSGYAWCSPAKEDG